MSGVTIVAWIWAAMFVVMAILFTAMDREIAATKTRGEEASCHSIHTWNGGWRLNEGCKPARAAGILEEGEKG